MLAEDTGRYQLGQELPLVLQCTIGDVPDTPARHPTAEVRAQGSAAWLYFGRVAADDQGHRTGFFRMPLQLGADFSTGRHTVHFRWQDSASRERVELRTFDIVGGGSADGAAVAMHHAERPGRRFLLTQTDAGLIKKGTNPR